MYETRGKPNYIPLATIEKAILMRREDIVKNGLPVPATNKVWAEISFALGSKIKPTTVHSYAVGARYGIREKLVEKKREKSVDACSSSDTPTRSDRMEFEIILTKTEFQNLLTEKPYKRTIKNQGRRRWYTVLRAPDWTEFISKSIFEKTRLRHGYHFKNHYITQGGATGKINGKTLMHKGHVHNSQSIHARF